MAVGVASKSAFNKNRELATTQTQTVNAAGDVTDPFTCAGSLALQITGAATAISVQMERSVDLEAGPRAWSPVADPITGNPSTGLKVEGFTEPGFALWRARIVSITGTARIAISTGH